MESLTSSISRNDSNALESSSSTSSTESEPKIKRKTKTVDPDKSKAMLTSTNAKNRRKMFKRQNAIEIPDSDDDF